MRLKIIPSGHQRIELLLANDQNTRRSTRRGRPVIGLHERTDTICLPVSSSGGQRSELAYPLFTVCSCICCPVLCCARKNWGTEYCSVPLGSCAPVLRHTRVPLMKKERLVCCALRLRSRDSTAVVCVCCA